VAPDHSELTVVATLAVHRGTGSLLNCSVLSVTLCVSGSARFQPLYVCRCHVSVQWVVLVGFGGYSAKINVGNLEELCVEGGGRMLGRQEVLLCTILVFS
jgi:hypothetical protein